jgi:hypothetical protein
VLPESWGECRERGAILEYDSNLFDVVRIVRELWGAKDFPLIYGIVRALYENFKRLPVPTEEAIRESVRSNVQYAKERCLPYLPSFTRETFSARQLWDMLPVEVREEIFGESFYRFSDFLKDPARQDSDDPFSVERISNGHGNRFRLTGTREYIPGTTVSEDSLGGKIGKFTPMTILSEDSL